MHSTSGQDSELAHDHSVHEASSVDGQSRMHTSSDGHSAGGHGAGGHGAEEPPVPRSIGNSIVDLGFEMLKDATETLNNVKDSVHGAFQDHTESQRKLDLTLQEILKVFQGNEKLIIKQGEVLRKSEDLIVRVGENQKALTDSMRESQKTLTESMNNFATSQRDYVEKSLEKQRLALVSQSEVQRVALEVQRISFDAQREILREQMQQQMSSIVTTLDNIASKFSRGF
ncbi:hypothetical protein CVT26_012729 [Gymnopilus dilepis]|uniref:Uncharacterized protein n=1 Tax=Gymnopilus dilepis TaxID=231916 RepID=A0A409WVB2_9AGAR|nr:hypothetical protein CVT26_012729 [Gymnopilus dilepis]